MKIRCWVDNNDHRYVMILLSKSYEAVIYCVAAEDIERRPTSRWVKEYWQHDEGFPSPTQRIYDFHNGARDYWEFGGSAGLGIEADVALHPVEVADFVTGFFFIDLKGDDLSFEDFE